MKIPVVDTTATFEFADGTEKQGCLFTLFSVAAEHWDKANKEPNPTQAFSQSFSAFLTELWGRPISEGAAVLLADRIAVQYRELQQVWLRPRSDRESVSGPAGVDPDVESTIVPS